MESFLCFQFVCSFSLHFHAYSRYASVNSYKEASFLSDATEEFLKHLYDLKMQYGEPVFYAEENSYLHFDFDRMSVVVFSRSTTSTIWMPQWRPIPLSCTPMPSWTRFPWITRSPWIPSNTVLNTPSCWSVDSDANLLDKLDDVLDITSNVTLFEVNLPFLSGMFFRFLLRWRPWRRSLCSSMCYSMKWTISPSTSSSTYRRISRRQSRPRRRRARLLVLAALLLRRLKSPSPQAMDGSPSGSNWDLFVIAFYSFSLFCVWNHSEFYVYFLMIDSFCFWP